MEKFVASNGIEIRIGVDGDVERMNPTGTGVWGKITSVSPAAHHVYKALSEFFLHERDQELGRWRFNAYLTVYEAENHQPHNRARAVNVLDERTGRLHMRHEGQAAWRETNPTLSEASAAYFAAHPEPKPWHDAKPGEVWAVTWDGKETACHVIKNAGSNSGLVFDDTSRETPGTLAPIITSGRRIWPEVS